MPHRQNRSPADLIESALQGARDDSNFPVRPNRPADEPDAETGPTPREPTLTPEQRDNLAAVPGERRGI